MLPASLDLAESRIFLEMDELTPEVAARVTINDHDAGGLINKPLRLEVTSLLHTGNNTIRIEPFAPQSARLTLYARKFSQTAMSFGNDVVDMKGCFLTKLRPQSADAHFRASGDLVLADFSYWQSQDCETGALWTDQASSSNFFKGLMRYIFTTRWDGGVFSQCAVPECAVAVCSAGVRIRIADCRLETGGGSPGQRSTVDPATTPIL